MWFNIILHQLYLFLISLLHILCLIISDSVANILLHRVGSWLRLIYTIYFGIIITIVFGIMYAIIIDSCISVSGNQWEESSNIFSNFRCGSDKWSLSITCNFDDKMSHQTRLSPHTTKPPAMFVAASMVNTKISGGDPTLGFSWPICTGHARLDDQFYSTKLLLLL